MIAHKSLNPTRQKWKRCFINHLNREGRPPHCLRPICTVDCFKDAQGLASHAQEADLQSQCHATKGLAQGTNSSQVGRPEGEERGQREVVKTQRNLTALRRFVWKATLTMVTADDFVDLVKDSGAKL